MSEPVIPDMVPEVIPGKWRDLYAEAATSKSKWAITVCILMEELGEAQRLLNHPQLREMLGWVEDCGNQRLWECVQNFTADRDEVLHPKEFSPND